MAVKYAFETLGATKVSLGVFENNPSAIHCYEASGFHSEGMIPRAMNVWAKHGIASKWNSTKSYESNRNIIK